MLITKEKTQYFTYALETEYSEDVVSYCRFLKDSFGWQEFSWDKETKKWRFKDPAIILMVKNKFLNLVVGPGVEEDLIIHRQKVELNKSQEVRAQEIKEAKTSSLVLKGIKGNLYEYQKLGVEFFLNSGGRALLADSPGVGKTAQALGYIAHAGFKRNLIVCPASVKFSWESEIEKWTYLKSFVIDPSTTIEDIPYDVECVIVNFDILKKFFNEFMKYKWDTLIIDEAHLIKNSTAIRTKIIKALSPLIPNVLFLTGTPVLSRPKEMFNMLSIIDPKVWNSYYSYAVKYCGGHRGEYGFEAEGATNLEELNEKINKYFLRRTKDEVLKELPPKNFIDIPIELPREERKQYDLVEESLLDYLKSYKGKSDREIEKSLSAEKLVKLNLLREINAMGKIPTAQEIIDGIIESGEKVIVFSSFNGPLEEMYEMYEDNAVLLLGKTKVEDRGDLVYRFQNNPETKIFFGGTISAGVGITLNVASNVIFLDRPWNPGDVEQSLNRAHRPGAVYECLNIYKITSKDSIDNFMDKLLKHKQDIIDKMIEGKVEEKENDFINEYIRGLELKYKK